MVKQPGTTPATPKWKQNRWGLFLPGYKVSIVTVTVSAIRLKGKEWWNAVDQGFMESSWISDKLFLEHLDRLFPKNCRKSKSRFPTIMTERRIIEWVQWGICRLCQRVFLHLLQQCLVIEKPAAVKETGHSTTRKKILLDSSHPCICCLSSRNHLWHRIPQKDLRWATC